MGGNGALIAGVTGGVIGAFFGVPGLGFAVGSLVGGLLFQPDAEVASGPRLGDSQNQQSLYGIAIPLIYGQARVAGNVFWGKEVEEFKTTATSGGKGGQPKQKTETFNYKWTGAISLCANEIKGIRRIWVNDQFYTDLTEANGNAIDLTIYRGTETQLPDPTIEALEGVGNVPAYRGLAYVVIKKFPLEGSTIPPTFHFEVITKGSSDIVAQVVENAKGPSSQSRKMALDPDSGLIWTTKSNNVEVFSCEGPLERVEEFPHNAAHGISHSPGFTTNTRGMIGNVPINVTSIIKPRMWVAPSAPDLLTDTKVIGYDTGGSFEPVITYSSIMNGSAFCWPGFVLIDRSLITTNTVPPMGGSVAGLVIVTNGACSLARAFDVAGLQPAFSPFFDNSLNGFPTDGSDFPAGANEGILYIMDDSGTITRFVRQVPIPIDPFVFQAEYWQLGPDFQVSSVFRNPNNSMCVDPIDEVVYAVGFDTPTNAYNVIRFTRNLEVVWKIVIPKFSGSFQPTKIRYHDLIGDIWMGGTKNGQTHLQQIDKATGEIINEIRVSNTSLPPTDMLLFPGMQFAVANIIGATIKIPLTPGAIPDPPFLSEIVTDLSFRTLSLTGDDIDVSGLTAIPVIGFTVSRRQSVRDILQRLLENYFIDTVEIDGKIKFVPRGTLTNVTIVGGDLSAHNFGSTNPTPVLAQRTQENELPRSMDSRFIDINNEYKISTVNSRRLSGDSQQIQSHDIPIVFTTTEAKHVNDTLLFNQYADREPRDFVISRKYLKLTPTDVVLLEDPDLGLIQLRINKVEFHFPQLLKIQGIPEDITLYSGFTFPGEETEAKQPVFPVPSKPLPIILDIPLLRTKDDSPGVYIGSYVVSGTFAVASIFRSEDFTDFVEVATILEPIKLGQSQEAFGWNGSFK